MRSILLHFSCVCTHPTPKSKCVNAIEVGFWRPGGLRQTVNLQGLGVGSLIGVGAAVLRHGSEKAKAFVQHLVPRLLGNDDCFGAAHEVLNNFDKQFPHWKGRGYEIAGFVWWQGHKDGGEPYASRYEHNLVHLIKTLRKEFDAPKAPFAIATIGFDGWKMAGPHKIVAEAQLAVSGDKGKYPEFQGNVLTVETRGFWREPEVSPRNQGFHYNQNAETYMLVGEALGKGMLELMSGEKE